MRYTVYALIDPRDYMARYIGVTSFMKQRYHKHLYTVPSAVNSRARAQWMQALRDEGLRPLLHVIEECSDDDAGSAEIYWIYKSLEHNIPLLNFVARSWQDIYLAEKEKRLNTFQYSYENHLTSL